MFVLYPDFSKDIMKREKGVQIPVHEVQAHVYHTHEHLRSENHFWFRFSFSAVFEMESLLIAVEFAIGWTVSFKCFFLITHLSPCHRDTKIADVCEFGACEYWLSWRHGNCGIHYPSSYRCFLIWGYNWKLDWNIE